MTGAELSPEPVAEEEPMPEPSPGAVIRPKMEVKKPLAVPVYDVSDAGVAGVLFSYPRSRDTGEVNEEGEPIFEAYDTQHQIQIEPQDTATGVEWADAYEKELKKVKRLIKDAEGQYKVRVRATGLIDYVWRGEPPEDTVDPVLYDEKLHELMYEDKPYKRWIPASKTVKFNDYDIIYDYHPNVLKETVILRKTMASIRYRYTLSGMKLKKVGGTDSWRMETDDGLDLGVLLTAPSGHDAEGRDVDCHYFYSAQGQLNIVITKPSQYTYPLTIDPSFSFDGTDFVIASAQTEIKTYQQLWTVSAGVNGRYNAGFMAGDSDGVNINVRFSKTLGTRLDLSAMTDFTIDVKTTNGDAAWFLDILFATNGSNLRRYRKTLANDVNATYTLTDFTVTDVGSALDMASIGFLYIRAESIDTGTAGNVTFEVKDFKFTTPVKTSDLYDSTGRFVLFDENFEGDDGLALEEYDPNWTQVAIGGASVMEIDDAQAPGGGSTSLLVYRDNINDVDYTRPIAMTDYTRVRYIVRAAQNDARFNLALRDGATYLATVEVHDTGDIRIHYGNGVGGSNQVNVAYAADTDYELWYDVDFTNDVYRVWINGVLYPGPNANAAGFDNFFDDGAAASADIMRIASKNGIGSFWLDDLTIQTGFEDFSALTVPHDVDDISESLTPTGSDYGRGTWDGDWTMASGGAAFGLDNTDVVIGTNSFKVTTAPTSKGILFQFDDHIDLSNTKMRFYVKMSVGGVNCLRMMAYDTGGYKYGTYRTLISGKWSYVEFDMETEFGALDTSDVYKFYFRNQTVGDSDMWLDGLHFQGNEDAGTEWQENSIDLNGLAYVQDRPMININKWKDTGASGTWTATMASATDDLTVEWSDVNGAGVQVGMNGATLTLTGYDNDNRITWVSVGDTAPAPANGWSPSTNIKLHYYLTNVNFKYTGGSVTSRAGAYGKFENLYVSSIADTYTMYIQASLSSVYHRMQSIVLVNLHASGDGLTLVGGTVANPPVLDDIHITVKAGASYSVWTITANIAHLRNCTFDETKIKIDHADGGLASLNHNKNGVYLLATGAGGRSYSDIDPDFKPTPNDIFYLAKSVTNNGTYNCDVGAQVNIIYRLEGPSGVTVNVNVEKALTMLDPDLSKFQGTLNKSFAIYLGFSAPSRPVSIPVPLPVLAYDI